MAFLTPLRETKGEVMRGKKEGGSSMEEAV